MNDLGKSVRNVMVIFLFFFVGLISYIAYFQVFKGPDIASNPGNVRLWAKRNEVLRGTIYDRNGDVLAKSSKVDALTQNREYVYGDLYAHALGYVDQRFGLTGLEAEFDTELSTYNPVSSNLKKFVKTPNLKNFFNIDKEEKVGNGVVTTLDPKLQKVASDALGNRRGSVVALNPKTGEVLAMVSKPTYNPADLATVMENANQGNDPDHVLINRALDGLYPPGSVFKTITMASALENDPSVANRKFEDNGYIEFPDGNRLYNFMKQGNGTIDLRTAFRKSSNVVFGTLAMELGNDKLKKTAEDFGFNNAIPGIGVTTAVSEFPTLKNYEVGMIAQSGIGQSSVLATPMQMALVAATIANDGVMMQPKLVNKVVDKDGKLVDTIDSKPWRTDVIPKDVAAIEKDYMTSLVTNNLYRWPAFEGTNAGAKTGTADYNLPDGTPAVPHGWFISAAPMNDPQIAVAVIIENGDNGAIGAADVASKVVRAAVVK